MNQRKIQNINITEKHCIFSTIILFHEYTATFVKLFIEYQILILKISSLVSLHSGEIEEE